MILTHGGGYVDISYIHVLYISYMKPTIRKQTLFFKNRRKCKGKHYYFGTTKSDQILDEIKKMRTPPGFLLAGGQDVVVSSKTGSRKAGIT